MNYICNPTNKQTNYKFLSSKESISMLHSIANATFHNIFVFIFGEWMVLVLFSCTVRHIHSNILLSFSICQCANVCMWVLFLLLLLECYNQIAIIFKNLCDGCTMRFIAMNITRCYKWKESYKIPNSFGPDWLKLFIHVNWSHVLNSVLFGNAKFWTKFWTKFDTCSFSRM